MAGGKPTGGGQERTRGKGAAAGRMSGDRDARRVDPKWYDLDNPYLTRSEKLEVELWSQFPGNAMQFAFLCCALWSAFRPLAWAALLGVPLLVELLAAVENYYLYNRRAIWIVYLVLLHNWWLWAVGTAAIVALILHGQYLLAGVVLAVRLGAGIVAEMPFMALYWVLFRKTGMHPKYAFFKRFYGRTFSFEESGSS